MEKELILMVGPIGSGKTTFAKSLTDDNSIRISQDEMSRREYFKSFKDALDNSVPKIIIDRMNFNKEQREKFIKPARDAGYTITIFEMKTNRALCHERVVKRTDHPNIGPGQVKLAHDILDMYEMHYEAPTDAEYDNYNEVYE